MAQRFTLSDLIEAAMMLEGALSSLNEHNDRTKADVEVILNRARTVLDYFKGWD